MSKVLRSALLVVLVLMPLVAYWLIGKKTNYESCLLNPAFDEISGDKPAVALVFDDLGL